MSRNSIKGTQSGLTLVEVIISMALMLLIISSSLSVLVIMSRHSHTISIHNSVQALISSKINEIRAEPYAPPSGPFFTDVDIGHPDLNPGDDYQVTTHFDLIIDKDDPTKTLPAILTTTISASYESHHVLVEAKYPILGKEVTLFKEFAVNKYTGASL